MKSALLLAFLPAAVLAAPQQATTTSTATSTTTSDLPCPTNPANCADRGGHLACLSNGVWCWYTDPVYHTPAFFPVDLTLPCPSCLPSS